MVEVAHHAQTEYQQNYRKKLNGDERRYKKRKKMHQQVTQQFRNYQLIINMSRFYVYIGSEVYETGIVAFDPELRFYYRLYFVLWQ
jgi:hypothetical protein